MCTRPYHSPDWIVGRVWSRSNRWVLASCCYRVRCFFESRRSQPSGRLTAGEATVSWTTPAARPYFFDYFTIQAVGGAVVGEDASFCAKWRSVGGKVWLDPTIRLTHHGMHEFTADPMTAFVDPAPRAGVAA